MIVGIELSSNRGNCGGDFEGKTYFKCVYGYGIFIPMNRVSVFIQEITYD